MTDEREGKLSASSANIVYHCPGAPALWKTLNHTEPESEIAAAGTRMHEAMETGSTDVLEDHNEERVVETMAALEKESADKWLGGLGSVAKLPPAFREFRLWIVNRKTQERLVSAKLDVHWVAIEQKAALALDYKSGFLDVTEAERNVQTRIQALTLWHEYPFLDKIRVGIVQGRTYKLDEADYDRDTLEMAEKELRWHLWMSEQKDAPRIPGKHCRYCPAKAFCHEAITYALLVQQMKNDIIDGRTWAYVWRRKGITEAIFDSVTLSLKSLPPEELAELGLRLKENSPSMELGSAQDVFGVLFTAGLIDAKGFHACCKALKGRVEKAIIPVLREQGLKVADAKARIEDLLKPVSEMKEKQPSLVEL